MAKITTKIAVPIVLAVVFALTAFIAVNYQNLTVSIYIVIGLVIVCVFFFGLAMGQSLSSPVKKILDNALKLSRGDLSSRVYVETKDELSELASTFNTIAQELQESYERNTGADKSLDIKVKARTRDLEETIDALEQKVRNRTIELEKLILESAKMQEELKKLRK